MNVIKQDFHGPARWFSGQKRCFLPRFATRVLSPGPTWWNERIQSHSNPLTFIHSVAHCAQPPTHTHMLAWHAWSLGSIPSNWEKRWGGSGRRKEWRRNIYERNLELCEWPSYICTLPHAPGHTLNAAPCTCHLLPCPPACLPVRSIFLLTRMTPPRPRHRLQFSAGT